MKLKIKNKKAGIEDFEEAMIVSLILLIISIFVFRNLPYNKTNLSDEYINYIYVENILKTHDIKTNLALDSTYFENIKKKEIKNINSKELKRYRMFYLIKDPKKDEWYLIKCR